MDALAVIPHDPAALDLAENPGAVMVALVEQARTMLAQAQGMEGLADVIEWKSRADAIRVYTQQKDMGHEAELSAAEIVRRAERRIGQLIREGQQEGDIATERDGRSLGGKRRQGQLGTDDTEQKPNATDLLGNGPVRSQVFAMTDDVDDDEFEEAISEAKEEGNLSRANVVRKVKPAKPEGDVIDRLKQAAKNSPSTPPRNMPIKARADQIRGLADAGYTSRQISDRIGLGADQVRRIAKRIGFEIPADAAVGITRNHDSARIVEEAAITLEALAMGLSLVDVATLDPARAEQWAISFESSLRSLNRFHKHMKEMAL